jgi:phosphomevalonate kinase
MFHFISIGELDLIIGILIASSTAVFGIFKYHKTRKEEFKKEFWKKRYEHYERILELTSAIAVSDQLSDVRQQIKEFRQYYWGKLAMIENQVVCDAMIDFGTELDQLEQQTHPDLSLLKIHTYSLARACRKSLQKTWEPIPLDDITHKAIENLSSELNAAHSKTQTQ